MTVLMLLVLPSPVEPVGRGRLLAHPIPLPAAGVRLSGSRAQHVGVEEQWIASCSAVVPCEVCGSGGLMKMGERDH